MTGRLEGKIAVVAGCRVLGGAIAELFAREGASVLVADTPDATAPVVEAIERMGGTAIAAPLDVTDENDWKAVADLVRDRFGGLHILVNEATAVSLGTLRTTRREDWDQALAVNMTGPLLGMQILAPAIAQCGGGSIINLGTTVAINGSTPTAYSASKWGLRGLSKSAAVELATDNIRVNCVHPGLVDSPAINRDNPFHRAKKDLTPLGRAVPHTELAQTVLFLASDESAFITGVDLALDGGFTELGIYGALWKAAHR